MTSCPFFTSRNGRFRVVAEYRDKCAEGTSRILTIANNQRISAMIFSVINLLFLILEVFAEQLLFGIPCIFDPNVGGMLRTLETVGGDDKPPPSSINDPRINQHDYH